MHYKTICQACEKIMGQCRCPSNDKETRYEICESCEDKGEQAQAQLKQSIISLIQNDDFFVKNVNYNDFDDDGFPQEVHIQLLPRIQQ